MQGKNWELDRRDFVKRLGVAGFARSAHGAIFTNGARAKILRGVFPIGQTPFTPDNKLDLDALEAEVRFCNRGRVHGFVWPQIASGWTRLSERERMDGAEAILAAGKGGATVLVIGVQTKDGDVAGAIRYAKHAARRGADAIISLPPANASNRAIMDYYKQLAKAVDLPLFVQSQGDMSVDLIVQMFKEIPTMKVVKDEAGNPLERVQELLEKTDHQLHVFSGKGVRTMITEMELGFSGHCPTAALADVYASAFDLYHAGKHNEAFDMFGRILAFDSIPGPHDSVLIERGVFKENTTFRPISMGAFPFNEPHRPLFDPRVGKKLIREALDTYMKPYLRA